MKIFLIARFAHTPILSVPIIVEDTECVLCAKVGVNSASVSPTDNLKGNVHFIIYIILFFSIIVFHVSE